MGGSSITQILALRLASGVICRTQHGVTHFTDLCLCPARLLFGRPMQGE